MIDDVSVYSFVVFIQSQSSFVIVNATAWRKRFFRLMNAPDIETRIVMIVAAMNSPDTMSKIFVLKKGVSFRMSRIITRNIMKIAKKVRASLVDISFETSFRFSPKKVPIIFCQTGDIIMVSFHGLRFG